MFSLALAALLLQASSPLELRTVTVVATDAKGAPVRGLTAADAVVLENGVAREVVELSLDSRPLTLAILVDTSAPMATPFRLTVAGAVAQFLNRLPESNRFAIWTTGDRPSKVADFGTDPAQASRALVRAFPTGGNTLLGANTAAGVVFYEVMKPGSVSIFIRRVEVEVKGDTALAQVRAIITRAGPVKDIKDIVPENADGFGFSMVLKKEDGAWKAASVRWESIGVAGLL